MFSCSIEGPRNFLMMCPEKGSLWNVLGLCEMRWKEIGEITTHEDHKNYFSGKDDRHEEDVGFLVHNNTISAVMGCRPGSLPYAYGLHLSTSQSCNCMRQLQHTLLKKSKISTNKYRRLLLKHQRKASQLSKGTGMQKIGEDAQKDWKGTCGPYCNTETNERGLRLLEVATINNLNVTTHSPPQKIQKVDLAQPKWIPPPDRLYTSETALSHIGQHRQNTQLPRSRQQQRSLARNNDHLFTSKEVEEETGPH